MKTNGLRLVSIALFLCLACPAFSQATQPTANLPLDYRANSAFNQGRYAIALPLLQELAADYIDQPDKLGPVEEQVRVCQKAIAAATAAHANGTDPGFTDPSTAVPIQYSLSAGRHPHVRPAAGQVLDIPIKELGNFDYDSEKGGNIPQDVINLSGCLFRTRGYMIPLDQAENISEFALVPSLFSCCFGMPPQTQHTIIVHLPPGKAVSYFPDELEVQGTLKVEEKRDEGFIVSIFDLVDVTSVKVAPQ
ncbi:MAG TPA: DUF3299 domain-containing protein [Tepidisphaeraceae bacterium]|nr:DUF3299 domain-containing protein [Tepidisphaeraceae bacterium]